MIYGHQANGSFVAHCPYWRNRPIAVIGAAIIAGNLMTASANKGVFRQPSTGQEVLYKCEDWHFPEYVTMTMRYFPS
jgi:hypothetical protein